MKKPPQQPKKEKSARRLATPSFQVALPLEVDEQQARALSARFEAARQLYNAILSEGQQRLRRMRADPDWQAARAIPRSQQKQRTQAYQALRKTHGFSDYALQAAVKTLRVGHLAEQVDAVLAQVLATRAYRTLNRVALGKARRVRFKSRGRGLGSIENKRNNTGLRFAFVDEPDERAPSLSTQKTRRRGRIANAVGTVLLASYSGRASSFGCRSIGMMRWWPMPFPAE